MNDKKNYLLTKVYNVFSFELYFFPDNLSAWERYEKQRTNFYQTLQEGNEEYKNIKKLYCTEEGKNDYLSRSETIETLKMSIQQIHRDVVDANSTLEKLLGNIKKTELAEEVIQD